MTFILVFSTFALVFGCVRWVVNNLSHAPETRRFFVAPWHEGLVAIMPESWTQIIVLLGLPLGFGFLSYACDEPLMTKLSRWLLALCAWALQAAASPIMSMHHCLCGGNDETGWDEALIPGLVVIFVYFCRRLACRRSKVSEPSTASPRATLPDDGRPSP